MEVTDYLQMSNKVPNNLQSSWENVVPARHRPKQVKRPNHVVPARPKRPKKVLPMQGSWGD